MDHIDRLIKDISEASKALNFEYNRLKTEINTMPQWMYLALFEYEMGHKEIPGPEENEEILKYHKYTENIPAESEEVPWCAAFVNWVLEKSGFRTPRSGLARSYLNFGEPCKHNGSLGSVCVFQRGSKPWMGHVGFLLDQSDDQILLLSGNMSNTITREWFPKKKLLQYRWPK